MYLFTRRRQINPAKARSAVDVVVEGAHRAQEITGLDVRAWMSVFSPDVGAAVWSARLDDLEQLEVANGKLLADNSFGEFVEKNDSCFLGPLQDSLSQLIHGQLGTQVPEYIMVARSQIVSGDLAAAMGLAIEIAETSERLTGAQTLVRRGVTGSYGEVAWTTGAQDMKSLQANDDKIAADPTFLSLVNRASEVFAPATVTILQRLA